MRKSLLIICIALFVPSAIADTTLIKNVTVIPMTHEGTVPGQTVLVEGDRIFDIGDDIQVPEGTRVIDGSGKFLMPGLAEMHGHTPVPDAKPDSAFVRNMMFLYVANGVTTVRGERRRVLKTLHDQGVGILMGTDSPQIFSVPGFSVHRELAAMAGAGLSNYDILKSGTYNVGVYLQGKDAFGVIALGHRADMLLLNRNPLEGITAVKDRAGVMVRGQWFSETEIQKRLKAIAR